MSLTSIEAKIEEAMAARLAAYPSLPDVAWPGLQYPAPGSEIADQFIEFRMIRNPLVRANYDTNRYEGVLRLTLKTRLPASGIAATEAAGKLAAFFNELPRFTDNGINVILQQPAGVLGDFYEDGWVMHPVEVTILALE